MGEIRVNWNEEADKVLSTSPKVKRVFILIDITGLRVKYVRKSKVPWRESQGRSSAISSLILGLGSP